MDDDRSLRTFAGAVAIVTGGASGIGRAPFGRLRRAADYQLSLPGPFLSARFAVSELANAEAAVARLDALEADPARRTAAVGSIPP